MYGCLQRWISVLETRVNPVVLVVSLHHVPGGSVTVILEHCVWLITAMAATITSKIRLLEIGLKIVLIAAHRPRSKTAFHYQKAKNCGTLYPTMHHFGIPSHTQPMLARSFGSSSPLHCGIDLIIMYSFSQKITKTITFLI